MIFVVIPILKNGYKINQTILKKQNKQI